MAGEETYTVLIVEDNEMNMTLVRDILSIDGYELLEAFDGEDAIKKTLEFLPDVILMDINLPEMDGETAMKKIKSLEVTSKIPIIALTASAMKGEEEKFIVKGFDGYVAKPVSRNLLLEQVRKAVGEKV